MQAFCRLSGHIRGLCKRATPWSVLATAVLWIWLPAVSWSQAGRLDSLVRLEMSYTAGDTAHVKLLTEIARDFYSVDPAKGADYAARAVDMAGKIPDKKFLAGAHSAMGRNLMALADYAGALESYLKALAINEHLGSQQGMANNYNNIGLIYQYIFDAPKALTYYQKSLAINERIGTPNAIARALGNIGNIYNELSEYNNSIACYQRALAYFERAGNRQDAAGVLVNIGNVYTSMKNYEKALEYKQKALAIQEELGNQARIANNLSNIGNVYAELGDYARALEYQRKSLDIYTKLNDRRGIAANYQGIGNVYLLQKSYPEAFEYQHKARDVSQSLGLLSTESEAVRCLSELYEATGQFDSAYVAYRYYIVLRDSLNNTEKQKEVAKLTLQYEFSKTEDSLRQQQLLIDAKLKESTLLAAKQQQELLLKQQAINLANKEKQLQHLAYLKTQADLQREQTQNKAKEERLALVENEKMLQAAQVNLQQAQLELKDRALESQKTQRYFYLAGIGLLLLLSFFIFRNYRIQQKSNVLISREKKKSDALLLNILPQEVAEELKEKGEALARHFNEVTVLFTDFVDFTKTSENLSPQELVGELHTCFKAFDDIIEKYGLEKIKTIGDAYMAVSGLPLPDARHAQQAARAALDILQFVEQRRRTHPDMFRIRIGLHSGPVVAGIVGVKKFAYDIWGDTVNTAARLESTSEPGKINISGATHDLIRAEFACTYRGKIAVKNKGEMDMFFLEQAR